MARIFDSKTHFLSYYNYIDGIRVNHFWFERKKIKVHTILE